jgi:hypothetical protein
MSLDIIDIEAGPWGGVCLLLLVAFAIFAIAFTGWLASGLLLILVVGIPLTIVVYIVGRRVIRRLVHGAA